MAFSLLYLCFCVSSYVGPMRTRGDLILTSHTCKEPISREGHILRIWVDMNFGGQCSTLNTRGGCSH